MGAPDAMRKPEGGEVKQIDRAAAPELRYSSRLPQKRSITR